jgi:hypothetical protein
MEESLPGFFVDADKASLAGQRQTLAWTRIRLVGTIVAAVGGALTWSIGRFDLWGCVALAGFAAALASEILLLVQQPERDWYAGRALAESAKTLAWRYAVGGAPFFPEVVPKAARSLLHERLRDVADKGRDRITLDGQSPTVTAGMNEIRNMLFGERKKIYLKDRIESQRNWYAGNARKNRQRTKFWRVCLIVGETLAVVLAGGRAFGAWSLDVSGILAAVIASSAAWLGLKEYSALASAYSVAAAELGLLYERLMDTDETNWPQAVADAEEAISREHTMWLASQSSQD